MKSTGKTGVVVLAGVLLFVSAANWCGAAVIQTFSTDVNPFPGTTYDGWSFASPSSTATARVSGGVLQMTYASGAAAQGHSTVTFAELFGMATLTPGFTVSCDTGGATTANPGGRLVGISIGNIAALYYPGYSDGKTGMEGGFTWRNISGGTYIGGLTDMDWVPSMGTVPLQSMSLHLEQDGAAYRLSALITEGVHSFTAARTFTTAEVGTLDNAGLLFRATNGTGLYDNFSVTIPEPMSGVLWAAGAMILAVWMRRRRNR